VLALGLAALSLIMSFHGEEGTRGGCRWHVTTKGTTVLVIESRGHRAVDVSAWTDPVPDVPGEADTYT
jgi:hypothetical protein